MKLYGALLTCGLLLAGAAQAQDMDLVVELLGPLGTDTNRKGDKISARVVSPDELAGDIIEGKVTEVKRGNKIHGRAVLNFSFETLNHGGQAIPVATEIKSVMNSKGQVDVDEEGRVIRKKSNVGKAVGGTALGGLIGGIAGGAKGAAIGAGVGAAASLVLIQVAAEGPSVRFDAGSKIVLSAKSRSGPALSSLTPNEAPAAEAAPAEEPAPAAEAAPAGESAPAAQAEPAAAAGPAQPDLTAVKADFVPGEKVLFYDDFTDMAGDDPPPHWKVRGGSVELRVGGKVRQLQVTGEHVAMWANLQGIPKNFTVENEMKFDNPRDSRTTWYIHDGTWESPIGAAAALRVTLFARPKSVFVTLNHHKEGELGRKEMNVDMSQPVKEALWVQNGRIRLYINGERVIDVNQIDLPALKGAVLYSEGQNTIGYRMIRIAESTPDFSQVIASSGRYVTHGILFDTDSDRLQPDSAAVIKQVAAGLQRNPNLKLMIEGHTDSTGSADHNLDLSKRRAEAVKAVLVSQFGVEEGRLATNGLGSSKPIDSNDTPGGRAQNRRVEFVKQ